MATRLLSWVFGRRVEWASEYQDEVLQPRMRGGWNQTEYERHLLGDDEYSRIDNLCYCSGRQCETGYKPCTTGCTQFTWDVTCDDNGHCEYGPKHCPYCCNQKAGSCGFSVACCRQGMDDKPILKCLLPPMRVDEFEVYVELDSGSNLLPNFRLLVALLAGLTFAHVYEVF
eukprot:g695.t1